MYFVGEVIEETVSIMSTVVSKISPVIIETTYSLLTKLPEDVLKAKAIMEDISFVISKVAEFLKLALGDVKTEELGAKVMQENVRPQMEGETTQDYLDYLRREVQLDEEKYSNISITEKVACSALGTAMVAKSIQEKTGVELPPEFLLTIVKSKMIYEQVAKFIEIFSNNGLNTMGILTSFITNNLSEKQTQKVRNIVKQSLKELNPEMSESDIQKEIVEMKREYNKELLTK